MTNIVELADGGTIEPDSDRVTIRRKDKDGNTEEIRRVGEDDCQEWLEALGNY